MPMSYSQLVGSKTDAGSIMSWVNYARLDVESVLEDAQAIIYQQLRVRQMQAALDAAFAAGDVSISLPVDFIATVEITNIADDTPVGIRSWDELERLRRWTGGVLDTGDVCNAAILGEELLFDAKASSDGTLRIIYYRVPPSLSAVVETNFLTVRYPHLVRTACIAMAARYMNDSEVYNREITLMATALTGINAQADIDDHFGQHMTFRGP